MRLLYSQVSKICCDILDSYSNFNIKHPQVSQTTCRKRKDSENVPLVRRYKSGIELSMNKTLVKRRACKC